MRRRKPLPDTRPHWSDPDLPGPMGNSAEIEQAHFAYLMNNTQQGILQMPDGTQQLVEYVQIGPDQFMITGPKWRNDPTYNMRKR